MDFNNMIGLDFPDIEGSVTMVGKFGQFGAPKKEISEVEVLRFRVATIPGVGVAWSRFFSQKESESDSGFSSTI